ncbi:hypothetical protein SVIOM74S_05848 [Streptomyces violarus]
MRSSFRGWCLSARLPRSSTPPPQRQALPGGQSRMPMCPAARRAELRCCAGRRLVAVGLQARRAVRPPVGGARRGCGSLRASPRAGRPTSDAGPALRARSTAPSRVVGEARPPRIRGGLLEGAPRRPAGGATTRGAGAERRRPGAALCGVWLSKELPVDPSATGASFAGRVAAAICSRVTLPSSVVSPLPTPRAAWSAWRIASPPITAHSALRCRRPPGSRRRACTGTWSKVATAVTSAVVRPSVSAQTRIRCLAFLRLHQVQQRQQGGPGAAGVAGRQTSRGRSPLKPARHQSG